MTSVAHGQGVRRSRAGAAARTAERPSRRRTFVFAGGVAWIVVFAVLLAGVVAINVAVLRLNLRLDQASRDQTQLQADNSLLRSELSSSATTARIERLARGELGMVPANPDGTIYVHLAP